MQYSNSGGNILAASELLDSILTRFQRGAVISELESEFGLKRDHLFYLRNINSKAIQSLALMVNARAAVTLNVDVEKLNLLLSSCVNANNADVNALLRNVDANFNGLHAIEYTIANQYIDLIYSELDLLLDASKQVKFNAPPKTLYLLSGLTGLKKSIVPFVMINKGVFTFDIDLTAFTFALRAFDAKYSQVNEVISLIKMGADFDFVKTYNGYCDVSIQYFKNLRKIFDIQTFSTEKLAVKKKLDIYESFNGSLKSEGTYKKAVIQAHIACNVPIEIVVKVIKKFETEIELDDEILESQLDELHRLLP